MSTAPAVTIYTAAWCGFCHMAKQYMDQKGIMYRAKDVEKEAGAAQEAVEKSGQMGIPVVDVDGIVVIGFDRPRLDAAFKEKGLV